MVHTRKVLLNRLFLAAAICWRKKGWEYVTSAPIGYGSYFFTLLSTGLWPAYVSDEA